MFDEATQQLLLQEFVSENREALQRIERELLLLESAPNQPHQERLNSIFRDMHTVKGNCRMMEFKQLEELTHAAETLLDLMRDGTLLINQQISTALLRVLDLVGSSLQEIVQSGSEGDADFAGHIGLLEQLLPTSDYHQARYAEVVDDDDEYGEEGPILLDMSSEEPILTPAGATENKIEDNVAIPEVTPLESVRLSIDRLDTLMNHVGELGATFNQLNYVLRKHPDQVDQVLEEHNKQIQWIQGEVVKYRLQPIGRIWSNYHRLVRDLAVETGKKVVLDLVGEETEIDRNILVAIRELLGHLIRNAVDHGIEAPEHRIKLQKPPIGRITLSAEQKQGQIYLQVADDGCGINIAKVVDIAIHKELIRHDQVAEMEESELLKLIMLPGFSTAQQVSKISGRGTGMDVVQSALDKIGGLLTISSVPGVGSQFQLRIPQTMAIVSVLLVKVDDGIFALPQVSVVELISFYGQEVQANIEEKMQSPMVRVRDKLLPLISIGKVLVDHDPQDNSLPLTTPWFDKATLHVVVVQVEESLFGLEVDEILEPANLVIKPINRMFSHIKILAGTAVMPDGSVSFLLNVYELTKMSNHDL